MLLAVGGSALSAHGMLSTLNKIKIPAKTKVAAAVSMEV